MGRPSVFQPSLSLHGVAVQLCVFATVADPACWSSSGFTRGQCCRPLVSVEGCWDFLFTHDRCCREEVDLVAEPPIPYIAFGKDYVDEMAVAGEKCWPGAGQETFARCCDVRFGTSGNQACFARSSDQAASGLLTFAACCFPALIRGLDLCEDRWCMTESWSPLPIIGMRGGVLDHRAYIGLRPDTEWHQKGISFARFLQHRLGGRITPRSRVLDIACGPLRMGRHLIPFLDPDGYRGIDKAQLLIEQGYFYELRPEDRLQKRPRFAASPDFDFQLLAGGPPPDVSLANSLITHLNTKDVRHLLRALRRFVNAGHVFFATYVTRRGDEANPERSTSQAKFRYRLGELSQIASEEGWRASNGSNLVWRQVLNEYLGPASRAHRHTMLSFKAVRVGG